MPQKGRILIADNDEAVLESIGDQLESAGYRAALVSDAASMRQALEEAAFDMVIVDIRFGGAECIEIIESLKRKSPNVPVLVISEFTATELNSEAIKAGAFDLLNKPFTFKQLITQVNSALRKDDLIDLDEL